MSSARSQGFAASKVQRPAIVADAAELMRVRLGKANILRIGYTKTGSKRLSS